MIQIVRRASEGDFPVRLLKQLQISGRRRVDFHIRRNEQAGDVGTRVTAVVAPKEINVTRVSTAMAAHEPKLDVSTGT